MIELAVLDIAGTTVDEGGTVYRVLADAVRAAGGDPTEAEIEQWMGAGKREAIQALLTDSATDPVVDAAFADFRARLGTAYRSQPPVPFPGVESAIAQLRASGVRVALSTGFDREVAVPLLDAIGWGGKVVDTIVCIDDVRAGRPAPYLIFHAMEATGVADVAAVLTAGDTTRDVEAGRRAGARLVVAVRTGHVGESTLAAAGPTHLLDSVADIPDLLAVD